MTFSNLEMHYSTKFLCIQSFQVRIGNMDGVMVAYHNTERIFGFQYISLDEMDERLFGPVPGIGNKIFNHCVEILEAVLVEAANIFPDQVSRIPKSLKLRLILFQQSVLCAFETRVPGRVMDVYVRPMKWEGSEEERPIEQLLVTLEHKVNGEPMRVAQALRTTDEQCTFCFPSCMTFHSNGGKQGLWSIKLCVLH